MSNSYERERELRRRANAVLELCGEAMDQKRLRQVFLDDNYTPGHVMQYCLRSKNKERFAKVIQVLNG